MKKTLVLAAAMALALTACGGNNQQTSSAASEASTAAAEVSTEASSAAATDEASADASSAETSSEETTGEASAKPDGIYKAETNDATVEMDYGYRDTLEVEYKDGKIVSVVFESYDKDGNKKSEIDPATYPMDPPPAEWIPQLTENILNAGTSDAIDTVTGATNSSSNAIALLKAIEQEGVAGETLSVDNTGR